MDCFPTPLASARWLCLAVLLVTGSAGAQSLPPGLVTGAPTTQHLTFAAGPNQVSLSVFPADRSIEAIFGAELAHVLLVKDAAGAVHSTQYGVRNLTQWPWDASVWVYAREPFSLDVSGPRIEPWSQIPLAAGWSWVPSLVAAPMPVADAVASLSASLSRIEDGAGRAYPAAPGETALTTLEPGAGYRLRLAAPATLAYAAVPPTSPPPTVPPGGPPPTQGEVPTVLDAIALTGLVPGQEVAVRGFRADGDGGAGRLRVTTSGCAPDGGTCFVPTEHTAAGEPYSSDWGFTLYGDDLQWESFRLCHSQASAPQNATQVTGDGCFEALQLHGHGARAEGRKLFDSATGNVEITGAMNTFARLYDGSPRQTAVFRYSTDTVRLERVVEPMTLEGQATTDYTRPEWWGGQPDHGDATDAVAWALEAAEAKAAAVGREVYVVLSGMYGYSSVLETQSGTVLKGARGGVRDGQGLRVMAGAPWHFWALMERTTAFREPLTERDAATGGEGFVVVRHGRQSTSDRVVDVEIDGNLAQNGEVFDAAHRAASGPSSYSGGSYVDEMLQNTPYWNGFVASHQHEDIVVGSRTRLENVHIHDVGGNLWLSGEKVDFGGSRDVRLGNSARNHVAYGIQTSPGTSIDRVEVYGFFWKGALEVTQGAWRDVTFRDLRNPPALYTGDGLEVLVSHRSNGPIPAILRTSTNYYGETVTFDGLTFDMGEAYPYTAIIYDRGPMSIRNVTVRQTNGDARLRLVTSRGGDSYTSRFRLENVTVESGGLGSITVAGRNGDVRNFTLPPASGSPAEFALFRPLYHGIVYTLYGVHGVQRSSEPIALEAGFAGASADLFVRDAAFTDTYAHFMFTGANPADTDVQQRFHAYFRDVSFSEFTPINNDGGQNRENWRVSFYDDVRVGTRRSEDSGSLTSAALVSGRLDVPTNLFYAPFDPSYVTVTGVDAGRFTGWTNAGTSNAPVLRLAFSGTAPVSVSWAAAVRPIPAGVVFPD